MGMEVSSAAKRFYLIGIIIIQTKGTLDIMALNIIQAVVDKWGLNIRR